MKNTVNRVEFGSILFNVSVSIMDLLYLLHTLRINLDDDFNFNAVKKATHLAGGTDVRETT